MMALELNSSQKRKRQLEEQVKHHLKETDVLQVNS